MCYLHNFPLQIQKTNNEPVWATDHVSLLYYQPLGVNVFQTSWSHLEVIHLLLRELLKENKQTNKNPRFYHIRKPIFYFSNAEWKKKIILRREFSNLYQSVVQIWNLPNGLTVQKGGIFKNFGYNPLIYHNS